MDPGLDGGTDNVNVEEHHGGEDETEKIKDVWGVLSTDGLDVHPSGSGRVHEGNDIAVLAATADLAPFGGKSGTEFESEYTINTTEHSGVGNPKRTSRRWVNSVRDITIVTNKGLKVIVVGNVPGLDVNGIPVLRSGSSTYFNGEGQSVIGQTLEMGVTF